MGQSTYWLKSAGLIGLHWDADFDGWKRSGLPCLSNIAGSIQHFKSVTVDGWRSTVAKDLCSGAGFRGGSLIDIDGSFKTPGRCSCSKEIDKALFRSILVGVP